MTTPASPGLVKEYAYNCPWCKGQSTTKIRGAWPISTPISWDKYYIDEVYGNRTTIGSGIAAGVTIGVFFTVFLLTFGCRLYNARIERIEREEAERTMRNTIVHREDFIPHMWSCGLPADPPPPYELAITMPRRESPPPPLLTDSSSTCSINSEQQRQRN
ncbi:unnamed protein product [Gongylonema pulchrum]|uniref:LITAF domain-containing protein n=1 Tax=Gongylonema pulchrum TaxID=637853 RepID=A0A183D1Z5_9BILA|nr:unnamed protein product [Gongylonema pulchrum]